MMHAAVPLVAGALGISTAAHGRFLKPLRASVQDDTTIDHAGTRVTGGSLDGVFTILDGIDGSFVPGEHLSRTCIVLGVTGQGIELQAPCTAEARSEVQWYTVSRRSRGDVETGSGARLELAGGTGAFADVTGSCSDVVCCLNDGWVALMADCAWQRKQG